VSACLSDVSDVLSPGHSRRDSVMYSHLGTLGSFLAKTYVSHLMASGRKVIQPELL